MKSTIPLDQFRAEMMGYDRYILSFDAPLSPMKFSLEFDCALVNIAAYPYVCLKNRAEDFCISHIKEVQKGKLVMGTQSYILICNDFAASQKPIESRILLRCA